MGRAAKTPEGGGKEEWWGCGVLVATEICKKTGRVAHKRERRTQHREPGGSGAEEGEAHIIERGESIPPLFFAPSPPVRVRRHISGRWLRNRGMHMHYSLCAQKMVGGMDHTQTRGRGPPFFSLACAKGDGGTRALGTGTGRTGTPIQAPAPLLRSYYCPNRSRGREQDGAKRRETAQRRPGGGEETRRGRGQKRCPPSETASLAGCTRCVHVIYRYFLLLSHKIKDKKSIVRAKRPKGVKNWSF